MSKQEEYNEFDILENAVEVIKEQTEDLKEIISIFNTDALFEYFSHAQKIYNTPLLIHISREVNKDYWGKKSTIISSIEEILTEDIQCQLGGYKIKFVNIRNMTFGIYSDDDLELVRFSLMEKNYMFMKWSVVTEEGYIKSKDRSKKNIKSYEDVIVSDKEKLERYQKYEDNYLRFFKDVKNLKNLYDIIFKSSIIKTNLWNLMTTKKRHIECSEEIIEKEKEAMKLNYIRKIESRAIITDINLFFSQYGYKREDEDYIGFYF